VRALLAFGLAFSLLALAPAHARGANGNDAVTSSGASEDATPVLRASVVIVSRDSEHQELAALLDELLRRQAIVSELSHAARFDSDALFLEPTDGSGVLVFVVIEPRGARLYFRGPGGERFLLRKLVLPSGLDAVGKELIAHVVESATLALLRSTEGLSREQASAELTREVEASSDASETTRADENAKAATPQKAKPLHEPALRAPPSSGTILPAFELAFGARYGAFWAGSGFGFSHGPGAELSVAHRVNRFWLVRVRVLGERHFSQTLSSAELEASVRSTPLRGGVDLGFAPNAAHRFFLAAAAGADLVHVVPGPSVAEDIVLGSASTRAVPVLRFELRYELVFGHVALAAAGFVDASLVETRYELAESGTRRPLNAPLQARPGAALAVTWSP
jgi:hypothetical protein